MIDVLQFLRQQLRGGAPGSASDSTAALEAVQSFLSVTNEASVVEVSGRDGEGRTRATR